MDKQKQNKYLRKDCRRSHWGTSINFTGQIFNLDSAVLKTPSSHKAFLTDVMYQQRETTKSFNNTVSPSGLFTMILLTPFFDATAAWRIINIVCLILPSLIAGVNLLCYAL